MQQQMIFIAALILSTSAAFGDMNCPSASDVSRNSAVLKKLFNGVKPDPLDEKTSAQQDEIFKCLEKLIEALGTKELAGKNIRNLVLLATRAAQYKNDLYASEYLAEIGTTIFKKHKAATFEALKGLRANKTLSSEDESLFLEMTALNP